MRIACNSNNNDGITSWAKPQTVTNHSIWFISLVTFNLICRLGCHSARWKVWQIRYANVFHSCHTFTQTLVCCDQLMTVEKFKWNFSWFILNRKWHSTIRFDGTQAVSDDKNPNWSVKHREKKNKPKKRKHYYLLECNSLVQPVTFAFWLFNFLILGCNSFYRDFFLPFIHLYKNVVAKLWIKFSN